MDQYLVIPDLHYPFHDPKFIKLTEIILKDLKPQGVCQLGDALDFFQISSYDKDPHRINTVYDDLIMYRDQLDRWENMLPKGTVFHQLIGNHEDRLRRVVWRSAPQIAALIKSIPEVLEFHERNKRGKVKFICHEYNQWDSCRIGDCFLLHGFYYNAHVASTLLQKYKRKVISGHTHRIQLVYDQEIWACSIGHGSNESETSHNPTPTQWSQAFAVLTVVGGKSGIELIHVKDGQCNFRGKRYEV